MPIAGIEELIYRQKFKRQEFVALLRQLLPRGPIWRIPLPQETVIEANSILSSEAFGRVTITAGETVITPNGIASVEVFGTPTLNLRIYPNSIASGEAFGNPTITV